MHIIKLNATDSTNDYLKDLATTRLIEDYTVVIADHQKNGRGQRGSNWISQPGKNLTMSIYKELTGFNFAHHYQLSKLVSLSIAQTIQEKTSLEVNIKWPNDILAEGKKIGGILIENTIKNGLISSSIIGIGLNINQTDFGDLSNASSLLNLTGQQQEVDLWQQDILLAIMRGFSAFPEGWLENEKDYLELLYKFNEEAIYQTPAGNTFKARIVGVSELGKLKLQLEDGKTQKFDLKEITMVY